MSFSSLTKVLLPVRNLLTDEGEIVCLIKPQFEAGREKVGKKGVVRDPAVHQEVIEKVRDYAMSIFMEPCHLSFSPIKGPEGNIEYLLHLKKHPEGTEVTDSLKVSVEAVVLSVLTVSFAVVSDVDGAAELPQPASMDAVIHMLKIVASNFFFFILSSPF